MGRSSWPRYQRKLLTLTERPRLDDETEREDQSRRQSTILHQKDGQHDENVNEDVPNAHGVLLEGEQAWCASGSSTHSKGNSHALNEDAESLMKLRTPRKSC